MRRRLALLPAVALVVLAAPRAAADDGPRSWFDLAEGTVLTVGETVAVTGHSAGTATSGVKFTEVSLVLADHFVVIAGAGETDWSRPFTPETVGPLTIRTRVTLDDGSSSVTALKVKVAPATPPSTALCPCAVPIPEGDRGLYRESVDRELGLRFFTTHPGSLVEVAVAGAQHRPDMRARLWAEDGTPLAESTAATPGEDGVSFDFSPPPHLDSYTSYTVSYTVPAFELYAAAPALWADTAPATGVARPHFLTHPTAELTSPGVYGAGGHFPAHVYNFTDYALTPYLLPSA